MSNIQIELSYLQICAENKIPAMDAIILYLLYNKEEDALNGYIESLQKAHNYTFSKEWFLTEYQKLGYLKIVGDNLFENLEFRQSFINFITPNNSKINFDEFWDVFPTTTRSGRSLRAENKVFHGKPTRDYEVCKQKYLSKVKDEELHKEIVAIIKKRVELGEIEYINGIEVYINQKKWERDIALLKRAGKTDFTKEV